MKNLILNFFLCIAASTLLFSCSDDNDEPDYPSLGYIQTALKDFYTSDNTPMSVEIYNNRIYIGDIKTVINIFDKDFNHTGKLTDANGQGIEADVVRFNSDGSFFVHNISDLSVSYYDATGTLINMIHTKDLRDLYIEPITADSQGQLFVNYDNHSIRKYNSDLTEILALSGDVGDLFDTGEGDYYIKGLCTDNNNNVFVSVDVDDAALDAVLKFDNDLNFIASVGGDWKFNNPHGIAVDDADNVYVVSRYHHTVEVYDNDLNFLKATSNVHDPGDSNGMMNSPIGIGIDGKTMYVTEDENHCITTFRTYY